MFLTALEASVVSDGPLPGCGPLTLGSGGLSPVMT